MARFRRSVRSGAALLGAAALLCACSGGNEDVIRQQGELRSKLETQNAEVEALRSRVKDLESRSRSLEEQVAAVGIARPAAPAPAAAAPGEGAPGEADAAAGDATAEAASFLDSEAGKEKLREFLKEEEVRKEEADRRQMEERMDAAVKDRVTGYLTEQLNLTPDQQGRVIDIASEAARRMGEVWRGARGGPGAPGAAPADFQGMREKTDEIRKDAMDKLSQALTVDQYNKLEELGPGAFIGGGRGGFGGGPAAPVGVPGGERPRRGGR